MNESNEKHEGRELRVEGREEINSQPSTLNPQSSADRLSVPGVVSPDEAFIALERSTEGMYRATWQYSFKGTKGGATLPQPFELKHYAARTAAQMMLASARKLGWHKPTLEFVKRIEAFIESLKEGSGFGVQGSAQMPSHEQPSSDAETEYITLADAAKLFPGRPKKQCLYMWCVAGIKICRTRIYLRHERSGRNLLTTAQWVTEFRDAQRRASIKETGNAAQVQTRQPRQRGPAAIARDRRRDHADAMAELSLK